MCQCPDGKEYGGNSIGCVSAIPHVEFVSSPPVTGGTVTIQGRNLAGIEDIYLGEVEQGVKCTKGQFTQGVGGAFDVQLCAAPAGTHQPPRVIRVVNEEGLMNVHNTKFSYAGMPFSSH